SSPQGSGGRRAAIPHSTSTVATRSPMTMTGVSRNRSPIAGTKVAISWTPSTAPTATAATIRTSRQPTFRAPSATVGLLRDPDRRDEDLAGKGGSTLREQAGLRAMERDREVRTNDGLRGIARRQVDTR